MHRYMSVGGKVDLFTAAAAVAVSSWLPRSEDLSHHKTPPSGVSGDGHAAMPPCRHPWGGRGKRGEGEKGQGRADERNSASRPSHGLTWVVACA